MVLEIAAYAICLMLALLFDPAIVKARIRRYLKLRDTPLEGGPRKVRVLKNGTMQEFTPDQIEVDSEQDKTDYLEWLEEQSENALAGEPVDPDFPKAVERL